MISSEHETPSNDDQDAGPLDDPRTAALMKYEPWLRLIAQLEIDQRLRGKLSHSDVVQQTLMEAWRNWERFEPQGDPRAARLAWLRRVLANQLATYERRFLGAQKRDVRRERSIDQSLANTSVRLEALLQAEVSSPSRELLREEASVQLAQMLDRLPPEYREVIVLRNLEELSHADVAKRMNRSEGAVRMLWVRALARLKEEMDSANSDA